ncbi:MAG TPA: serine protease [Candidatus Pelethocola excrementipullorum]|nr:serine protease [Candidatus Pelethocola excrementipullorum]
MDHDQKPYNFIKEVIKKKELNKKDICIRIAAILGAGVLFGVSAAFVFAWVEPRASTAINGREEPPKVDIPVDEEPTPTPTPEGDVATASTSTPASSGAEDENKDISLLEYQQLYKEMLAVAETPKHAIVTVIGITNQMDYFKQNNESRKLISGLLVADNGQDLFILTEYRVVENVERIQVTFWDGNMVDAIYQKHDPNTGFTILKVVRSDLEQSTREGIEIAPLGNSYGVTQGEPILALGSPIGYSDSVAYGVITSVTNKISTIDTEYNLITTDIMGSKEGSGILINLEGEIIGIIAQGYSSEDNIITGLAISQVKQLIEKLSNNEQLSYVGIQGQDVTSEISDKIGIPKGVLVNTVQSDSPAMMSGIKEYDVIVKFGEDKITTLNQYQDKLDKCKPGQTVKITAMRKGAEGYAEVAFEVVVGEK